MFSFLYRVKAAQTELGQQILADFEEAFPSQGAKVLFCIFSPAFRYYQHSYSLQLLFPFIIPKLFGGSRKSVCQRFGVTRPSLILSIPKQC